MKVAVLFVAAFSLTAALAVVGPEANPPRKQSVESPIPAHQQQQRLHAPQQEKIHAPAVASEKTNGHQQTADQTAAYLESLLAKEVSLPEHYKAHLEAEAKIYMALSRRIDVDFENKPLRDVVRFFREELDIKVQLDVKTLEEASIDFDEEVTFHAKDITGRSALDFVLDSLSEPMTWIVRYEMVLITTLPEAEYRLTTKFYDVTDLVMITDADGESFSSYEQLMQTIKNGCDENALWFEDDDEGGTISPFDAPGIHCMVIRQTRAIHDEIEIILAGLRRLRKNDSHLISRSGEPAIDPVQAKWDPEFAFLVEGNNRFAFDLYDRLRRDNSGNLFVSPYSIGEAMGMVYAGARGETAVEIADVLHFEKPQMELLKAFRSLREITAGRQEEAGYELTVANRLWGQKGLPLKSAFLKTTRNYYGAELQPVDFHNRESAAHTINSWINRQTNGKIPRVISPDNIGPLTRLVLGNAIYFKGAWRQQFDGINTRPVNFYIGEKTVRVPTMFQENKFHYAELEGHQLLGMPYRGDGLSMFVILPEEKTTEALNRLELNLNSEKLESWLSGLKRRTVKVHFPRFKFTSRFQLRQTFMSMGMKLVFDQQDSDLSGIYSDDPVWLEWVIHEAYVDVNEKGTEAAAATLAVGAFGGANSIPRKVPVFRADHPFLFVIRDNRMETILFLGRVVNPLEG